MLLNKQLNMLFVLAVLQEEIYLEEQLVLSLEQLMMLSMLMMIESMMTMLVTNLFEHCWTKIVDLNLFVVVVVVVIAAAVDEKDEVVIQDNFFEFVVVWPVDLMLVAENMLC